MATSRAPQAALTPLTARLLLNPRSHQRVLTGIHHGRLTVPVPFPVDIDLDKPPR
ncbi:hypothetical protein [Streptosporangium sp. NPDC000396]|uniref:hypothetical protein n=1 Tax=Streptosporangium sp. NPDC000396 TaxID=3366185 RepID=UPI0036ACAFC7